MQSICFVLYERTERLPRQSMLDGSSSIYLFCAKANRNIIELVASFPGFCPYFNAYYIMAEFVCKYTCSIKCPFVTIMKHSLNSSGAAVFRSRPLIGMVFFGTQISPFGEGVVRAVSERLNVFRHSTAFHRRSAGQSSSIHFSESFFVLRQIKNRMTTAYRTVVQRLPSFP